MAQATVKTVQYLDPRIEPQPDPVYDYVIGPTQNQFYKIPASGLSNSNITFNNLTTLGIDRAYLDTFELELGVTITFTLDSASTIAKEFHPAPWEWTFDSFPFNKCCDEARVNINGGAFFSQPMSYIRAKERYMNQYELSKSYENVCPCHRAICQTESARNYCLNTNDAGQQNGLAPRNYYDQSNSIALLRGTYPGAAAGAAPNYGTAAPTRLGIGMFNYMQSSEGMVGGFNNSIVRRGTNLVSAGNNPVGWERYYKCANDGSPSETGNTVVVRVTWREPLFVSPFSSRYDATYGRPLYNITSMDFSFTMQNLGNMIRVVNFNSAPVATDSTAVQSYSINIDSAQLCYQVMTIPPILNKPLTTLVPYRRFVPYITDYQQSSVGDANTNIDQRGSKITITSGVYTFNEMPTAIWVFCAPNKADLQTNEQDKVNAAAVADLNASTERGNWDTNRLFAYIKKINISMANTTQILATAEPHDLYRIAKANGCEDSYWSWAGDDVVNPTFASAYPFHQTSPNDHCVGTAPMCFGAGSVLRLKPGVDLIVPDQPLIPGANANNMVFQCSAEFYVPPHSAAHSRYALWLLFEYVGVAAISPGQCEITMNPLGSGEIMAVSPVMSATSEATEGELEGSGFWDRVKRAAGIAGQLADDGIISMILKRIPGAQAASEWAKKHGFGEPSTKRSRGGSSGGSCVGGAVMGKGLNDWV